MTTSTAYPEAPQPAGPELRRTLVRCLAAAILLLSASASAQTTDFTNPALNTPIDGNNLTFHDLVVKYVAGNAIQSGVNVNNIDTFKTAKKSDTTSRLTRVSAI